MPGIIDRYKNIGILLPPENHGGQFQLALSVADSLIKHSHKYNFTILYYDRSMLEWLAKLNDRVQVQRLEKRTAWHRISAFVNLLTSSRILPMSKKKQAQSLKNAIDLLVIPFHGLFGYMHSMPYIITITSLIQRGHMASQIDLSFKERIVADIICKAGATHSIMSVADSSLGMSDLIKCYGISEKKVNVVPHMPAGYIYDNSNMALETAATILNKFNLPEKYLFYPAQFWRGKNHIHLLRSLKVVEKLHGIKIYAVLAGWPGECYGRVVQLLDELDLADRVFYVGFVSAEEIVALYKKATALVYPSLCGPTNIPPVEAMVLGTPVLCSNLYAMPEQVGDAGLLFDPFSVEDMADKIYRIWTDDALRVHLIQKGYERTKNMTQERYARQWESVIDIALAKIHDRAGPKAGRA
jgi:glycosyltransferase involved in cell wall biosynthesis